MTDDGEKEISEDGNPVQAEIEFEEEVKSLPLIVTIEDDSVKDKRRKIK